jgi:hypothetical protein
MSKVLELNSRVIHASMKGLAFLNFFEFLLEFSYEKSSSNVQCNCIDDKKDPLDSPPLFKHPFTSKWRSNIDVNITGWTTDTTESCLFLNHVFIKAWWKFFRKWNIAL